jgi:hypothetical protein
LLPARRELEDTTAIQVELLNTVREHKRAADEAAAHSYDVENELASVKGLLAKTQTVLVRREEDATRTTDDVSGRVGPVTVGELACVPF